MPLIQAGFELVLNQATDDTNGINKCSIFCSDSTETASQTITWGAAAGSSIGGSVGATVDLDFTIATGKIVTAVILYHDTTAQGSYLFPTQYYFENGGTFKLTGLVLSLA